jgi:hypothetical protein
MSIELPSATNNDYKNIVYQFQANGTFDGTTQVNFVGFSSQLINGTSSYQLTDAYEGVTFTTSGSGWLALAGGAGGSTEASYFSAYNSSSITPTINVSASVVLNDVEFSNNISLVSGSRITFDRVGVYDIQFSAQVVKTSGTNATTLIWIKKNGVDVPWTNTENIIAGNSNDEIVLAWNWYVEAQSGDYYEIAYQVDQSNVVFQAKTGVAGPDIPSWIVTVGSIGGGSTVFSGSVGSQNLQQVTNIGNTTTNDIITSGSFITNEFFSNPNTITTNISTSVGYNSLMVSPISLSGSITIVSGSVLKLI